MSYREKVADRLRLAWARCHGVEGSLRWDQIKQSEQQQWLDYATAYLDAYR